ncbi:hypothetical protein R6Q57_018538 [Mikania cordata]
MVSIQYREKRGKGLGYKECESPFNHNYSSMPRINTSVVNLALQSDHAFKFPIETVSLTFDPMLVSDDSEVCANSLNDTGLTGKNEERSAGRSTEAHSTITKEAGSKLNPNCETFVPTGSLEQASTSTSYDVKPFDPKEFHEKKVSPKAKPTKRSMRTGQSSKPRVKPQKPHKISLCPNHVIGPIPDQAQANDVRPICPILPK